MKQPQAFWLENDHLKVCLLDYGLRTHQIFYQVNGEWTPTLQTFASTADHLQDQASFGALVGRVAGRIRDAQFDLDGRTANVDQNHGDHHIHGGGQGMTQSFWQIKSEATSLKATLISPDQDMGYPGELSLVCEIHIEESTIHYTLRAKATKFTYFNPTWHHYFCLGNAEHFGNQRLWLNSSECHVNDAYGIALNETFRPHALGDSGAAVTEWMADVHPQIRQASGLDHYFRRANEGPLAILEEGSPETVDSKSAVTDRSSRSRIRMSLWASTPGLQVYSGQKLGAAGPGLALEPMVIPDAIHHPSEAPRVILAPQTPFERTMACQFSQVRD